MAFFSMEHTGFKTWLVANQKIWCILPIGACWILAVFLSLLLGKDGEAVGAVAAVLLFSVFGVSIIFAVAEANEKPNLIYSLIMLAPFAIIYMVLSGKWSHSAITTGIIVWSIISIVLACVCGFIIRKYCLINFDETVSKVFKLRSSIDIWSSEQAFAYRRGVDAFIYSFCALEMFAILWA